MLRVCLEHKYEQGIVLALKVQLILWRYKVSYKVSIKQSKIKEILGWVIHSVLRQEKGKLCFDVNFSERYSKQLNEMAKIWLNFSHCSTFSFTWLWTTIYLLYNKPSFRLKNGAVKNKGWKYLYPKHLFMHQ